MRVKKRGLFVVVVVVFLALILSSYGQTAGCYVYSGGSEDLYCVSDVLDTEAELDCDEFADCSMGEHFIPTDCSNLDECALITCSVDCQQHALQVCLNLGGEGVPDEQYDEFCTPGCCKIADRFCQFGLNQHQCSQKAGQFGYTLDDEGIYYTNPVGMDIDQCNLEFCQVELGGAQLSGTIKNEAGDPLAGALVTLEGTAYDPKTTLDNGYYEFPAISPSTYTVKVTAERYLPESVSLTLLHGDEVVKDFILEEIRGIIGISGVVKGEGELLESATISYSGPISGRVFTDGTGKYQIDGLPLGEYTFSVSKVGYKSYEHLANLAQETDVVKDYDLEKAPLLGVHGTTYVDINNNGIIDTKEETYGVKIYIDGVFKGYSQFPGGFFEASVDVQEPNEIHTISATYQDYRFEAEEFTLSPGMAPISIPLLLTAYTGECSEDGPTPGKEVESFLLEPVLGKKEVHLEWIKPCPEVIAYLISRNGEPLKEASPTKNNFIDDSEELEWGTSYTYSIVAVYDYPAEVPPNEQEIILGDEACEGKYHEDTGWDSFCITDTYEFRKNVYTCDDNILSFSSCAGRDAPGEQYFCSQITSRTADCVDAGMCHLFGDPFGLYYSSNACYGSDDPATAENYCYYDHSETTILNECRSCIEIESCYKYRSEEACSANNCLASDCSWVRAAADEEPLTDYDLINLPELVSLETGHGYCVEEDYQDDDFCSLCGPTKESTLFENYYCSIDVCSSLGRCFTNPPHLGEPLTSCTGCGEYPSKDANCYTYSSEQECAGAGSINKDPFGVLTPSDDQCSWNKCLWMGEPNGYSPGSCIKDGDGDGTDDCADLTSGGEQRNCKRDVSSPRTTIVPEGIQIISLPQPDITFMGDDNFHEDAAQRNDMGLLGYCLVSSDSSAQNVCQNKDYIEVNYDGSQEQELKVINLINSSFLKGKAIDGETYQLLFYSQDKYKNREELKEAFLFIDNVPPPFEVSEKIETVIDQTTLTVYLEGASEPMSCSFTINSVLPRGETRTLALGKEEQNKEVIFDNLPGIIYDLEIVCEDNQGNTNTKNKRYVFDLEGRINIISPPMREILSSSQVQFKVSTTIGAICGLFLTETNEKIADLTSDTEARNHQSPPLPGFIEKEYAGDYKVVCQELFSPETFEDYFHFTVDFTAPDTQIVLQEGSTRVEKPRLFGWEEYFVQQVLVDFECNSEGFECDKTFYCLGEGCDFITDNYEEYSSTLDLMESTSICYYSTDLAGNTVFSPTCGDIIIEGYGVILEKPVLHYYEEEQWGISNQPTFDWQFFTKVPTDECRFDFTPDFTYDGVPGFKILTPNNDGKYLFPGFPEGTGAAPYSKSGSVKKVFVKCRNGDGELGPEEKINLEYDPSAPEIEDAFANPDILTEGNFVELFVNTDDKTLCRYSDSGHKDYNLMNYYFPGAESDELRILDEEHQTIFNIGALTGLQKDFTLLTQCKNGAGDVSETEEITFSVDYTQLGGIVSIWPDGDYFTVSNITGVVQTTKNAVCEYKLGDGSLLEMQGAGGRTHSQPFSNLQEGYYQIPVRCAMGDHLVENEFTFTIDITSPQITEINDGNYSCGAEHLAVMLYTTAEENITAYEYWVYDMGDENSSNEVRTLVYNSTISYELPIRIPTANLLQGHNYVTKIRAQDKAGNWGTYLDSDGVFVVAQNYSICEVDISPPTITQTIDANSSCQANFVELHCEDDVGCGLFNYGTSLSSETCNTTGIYNGQKISFEESRWLCYYAEDYTGNNISSLTTIIFPDEDGDGLADRCDLCPGTEAGEVVDLIGCAFDQIPESEKDIDTDNDGLPDAWEKLFDSFACELNFAAADSNDDGILDGDEDYDDDGYNNLDEFRNRLDPCTADEPEEDELTDQERAQLEREREEREEELDLEDRDRIDEYDEEKPSIIPLILLIIGLLMIFGGTGYLVYFYKYSPRAKHGPAVRAAPGFGRPTKEKGPAAKGLDIFKKKMFRKKRDIAKTKKRRDIFGEFGPESEKIPHIEKALKGKGSKLSRLMDAAQSYVKHKEDIKPGLRSDEKGLFSKLENIAKVTKKKKEKGDIIGKEETEDIFSRLKGITKNRGKKNGKKNNVTKKKNISKNNKKKSKK